MRTILQLLCAVLSAYVIADVCLSARPNKETVKMESKTTSNEQWSYTYNDLFAAIAKVESGGLIRRGKAGEIGTYQIGRDYWEDSGMHGEWAMCWNDRYSRDVMWRYWIRYCPDAARFYLYERLACVHNGGPDGWRNDPEWFVRNRKYTLKKAEKKIANMQAYWQKVKAEMEAGKTND